MEHQVENQNKIKRTSRNKRSTPEQRDANKARNQSNKVAQYANPRTAGPTKAEKKLSIRQRDYEKTVAGLKGDNATSYKKPGSLKK